VIVEILFWIFITVVSSVAVWGGSFWLEESSEQLSDYYDVPYIVKGAIITAFGSSFPEVSSVVIATILHGEFNLGVGSVVGSAIFNILVIPAIVALYSEHKIQVSRKIADKEAKFYMVSISAIIIVICLSVIYNPVDSTSLLDAEITPYIAVLPLLLYVVYVFDQWQEIKDSDAENDEDNDKNIDVLKNWGLLLLSLAVIGGGIEALVRSVLFFGDITGIPSFIMGAVIVAGVTSVPDTIVSLKQARSGQGEASLANVFGSNTFDLLVAVPAGVILSGGAIVNFSAGIILLSILVAVTIVVFIVIRTDLDIKKREAILLIIIYISFIVWISLEGLSIISTIPGQ
jgi:cation:H+ antiporter